MPSLALRSTLSRTVLLVAASGTVAFAAGCGSGGESSGGGGGNSNTITATTGKDIFSESGCQSCHTLADAGAKGSIGPNLDDDKPAADRVASVVANGDGRMPSFKDRLTAEQIDTLAEYVASVAGQ